eukprot:scaffold30850_cov73-Phaeocystis_antarctica.AAC.4
MPNMLVTLDVSRLSAWLNDDALCRVERDTYKERRGANREAAGRAVAVGARGAHVEHALHGCDAERVETQRLVERRRALPFQRKAYSAGRGVMKCEMRARRREGVKWWRNKQRAGRGTTIEAMGRGHLRSTP